MIKETYELYQKAREQQKKIDDIYEQLQFLRNETFKGFEMHHVQDVLKEMIEKMEEV